MLEQTIRRADFLTQDGLITPRFGPLMNDSQIKNLKEDEQKDAFYSLNNLNSKGWKLESFASIIDVNQIRIQVAIFSRETK